MSQFDHEMQQALDEHNGAMLLEGNRMGPVHPSYRDHQAALQSAGDHVEQTFRSVAARHGVDPVETTRTALEGQYARTVQGYDQTVRQHNEALETARKMPAADASDFLTRHLGEANWKPEPKTRLMARTADRRDATVAARDMLVQRPQSIYADQDTIAGAFPEALREHVRALPGDVMGRIRSTAADQLRRPEV